MKTLLSLCFLFCALALQAAQSVTLAWDPNPENDIGGYIVYHGAQSRNYTNAFNCGNVTTNTVGGLVSGVRYYFAVTAYNTNGLESDFSDEVSWLVSTTGVLRVFPPLMTRTNFTLRGTNLNQGEPMAFYFDLAQGSVMTNWQRLPALGTVSNYAVVPMLATNWVYRMVGSNAGSLTISPELQFRTVPPALPVRLRFEVQIIQSASLSGPWDTALQTSLVLPYPPEGEQKFYRSLMVWAPEYAKEE